MNIEVLRRRVPQAETGQLQREQYAQRGIRNIREAIDWWERYEKVSHDFNKDTRVSAYVWESLPDLAWRLNIPKGWEDKSRGSLWSTPIVDRHGDRTQQIRETVNRAVKAQRDQNLELRDNALYSLEGIIKSSREDPMAVEGQVSLDYLCAASVLDENGYDASYFLEKSLLEADAILTLEQADDTFTSASAALNYEDVVKVAVVRQYFDVARRAIDKLIALQEKVGEAFAQDTISECLVYLGVAEFKFGNALVPA